MIFDFSEKKFFLIFIFFANGIEWLTKPYTVRTATEVDTILSY